MVRVPHAGPHEHDACPRNVTISRR
jgi:hypothetical protein